MRIRTLAFASIAIVGMGMAAVATPAQATEKDRHCVVNVAEGSTICFSSFTEAIATATGGQVTDAPDSAGAAMKSPRLAAQLNATSAKKGGASPIAAAIVIGIEWWDSDLGGATYTVTAPSGCTTTLNDIDWVVPSLPSNWNDEIGSYRSYANCYAKHFEHISFTGISTAFDGGQNDMGWMDDETSSIQWS
jgi:hypothetical protein